MYKSLITEVMEPNDPLACKFDNPIRKEIESMLKHL